MLNISGPKNLLVAIFGFVTDPSLFLTENEQSTKGPDFDHRQRWWQRLGEEEAQAIAEKAIPLVTAREGEALSLRFGIHGDGPLTLKGIGERFGVTRERIRQIEAKALRKLRHPTRQAKYLPREAFLAPPPIPQEPSNISNMSRRELLTLEIDRLDLSCRTMICLKCDDIFTIGALVHRTEKELLKTRNMGRKSVEETKRELGKLGLSLGMKPVRVFQINDCDWWIGPCTEQEILAAYVKETGIDPEEATGGDPDMPYALTDSELDRLKFHDEDTGDIRTFREEMNRIIAEEHPLPCFFGSTEG